MTITPIERRSVHEEAYERLRSALLDGLFPPGRRLTNRELAETLGVSVTPIREAIRRLASEGGLVALPNGSVAVPELDVAAYADDLGWLILRLEERAVLAATPRLTDADVAKLEATFAQLSTACIVGDGMRTSQLFREFYFTIFERSNLPTIMSFIEQLWLRTGNLHQLFYPRFAQEEGARHYLELLDALRRRDGLAAVSALERYHYRRVEYLLAISKARAGQGRATAVPAGTPVEA